MPEIISIRNQEVGLNQSTSIDFNVARLPTGTVIDMKVYVARGKKDGPVLLLTGGTHGDEINGVEIMRRIVRDQLHVPDKGTVICIPILNVFGFINFSREVPGGKDINRSFPGSSKGSLASQVAYYLMQEIVPLIDCGIDFHTGGMRINNYPQIRADLSDPRNLELCKAFAPPFIINSPFRRGSFRKAADQLGKPILVYEAGESLRLRKSSIDQGIRGARRVMRHLGMIKKAPRIGHTTTIFNRTTWIRARRAGMHYSTIHNGQSFKKQDVLGYITDPYGQYQMPVKAPSDGIVIAINNNPVVNRGDALLHIGRRKDILNNSGNGLQVK